MAFLAELLHWHAIFWLGFGRSPIPGASVIALELVLVAAWVLPDILVKESVRALILMVFWAVSSVALVLDWCVVECLTAQSFAAVCVVIPSSVGLFHVFPHSLLGQKRRGTAVLFFLAFWQSWLSLQSLEFYQELKVLFSIP